MVILTIYLIGVAIAAIGMSFVVYKDLEARPGTPFTVGDLLLFSGVSLFSWFAVLVLINEGFKFLIEEYSVNQRVQDILSKDLRK